ncbi:hypothetical protein HanPSC8_Chr04g0175191 [Helianthus annuus]|nr:hypothetical protein HanPSC8_Chr04g0175191 [Helianthus annuus]
MSASVNARDLPTTRSSSSWTFCCTSGCNTNLAKIHSISTATVSDRDHVRFG